MDNQVTNSGCPSKFLAVRRPTWNIHIQKLELWLMGYLRTTASEIFFRDLDLGRTDN